MGENVRISELRPRGQLDFDYERFPGVALRATDQSLPGHRLFDRGKQLGHLIARILRLIVHIKMLLGTPPWDTLGNRSDVQERLAQLDMLAEPLVRFQLADFREPTTEPETQSLAIDARKAFDALLNLLWFLMDDWGSPTDLKWYEKLFYEHTIPAPQQLKDFLDRTKCNRAFASWWVQGNNPLCVEAVTLEKLGDAKIHLEESKYARVMKDDTPGAASKDHRLYWADFPTLLAGLEPGDFPVKKRLPKPRVIFAVDKSRPPNEPFVALAIQDDSTGELVWSDVASPEKANDWMRAMLASLCANQLHHTFVSHFPRTHFVMEAVAVATLRELENPKHDLYWLLRAHIDGTLGFNETALGAFMDQSGADRFLMAPTLRTAQQLMVESRNGWKDFDFLKDLEQRGVRREEPDRFPYYPYRDDALHWWKAIESLVGDVVDAAYPDDAGVKNDKQLQRWAHVLVAKREDNGAELIAAAPTSRDELRALLQKILFTCTAYHAAVQIPLNEFDVSPLTAPGALYPDNSIDPPESMLAHLGTSLFQLTFFYFGDVVTFEMGDYSISKVTIPSKMNDGVKAFRNEISAIQGRITDANACRKAGPYRSLLPKWVSRSVDI